MPYERFLLLFFLFQSFFDLTELVFFSRVLTDRSSHIADLIQPSLGQLQPNLDEFMDTIEPLQGTV